MAEGLGHQKTQEGSASSLTIVRIKRRRDDPAEPEIILEAAGLQRKKQPRYDEVLLQFQDLSVAGGIAATPAEAPRRRFRRLRTVAVSVLEGMSEIDLVRLLQTQTQAEAAATGPEAAVPSSLSLDLSAVQGQGGPDQPNTAQRRSVRLSPGPSQESCMAALRMSHRQFGVQARFKQIRRKRESMVGGAAVDAAPVTALFHLYDLERLPGRDAPSGGGDAAAPRGRRQPSGSKRSVQEGGRQQAGPHARPNGRQEQHQLHERQQRQQQQQQPELAPPSQGLGQVQVSSWELQQQPKQEEQQQLRAAAAGAVAGSFSEFELIERRYGPLVEGFLRSLGSQQQHPEQPQAVRRIPARSRHHASPQRPAQQQPQLQHPQPEQKAQLGMEAGADDDWFKQQPASPAGRVSPPHTAVAMETAGTGIATGTTAADNTGPQLGGEDGDAFVYDVYIPVSDDEEGGDPWTWLDAPSAADLAVPVIEVAEDDDEFFWAGQLEADAAQRAAAAEEHDSEDSNAESYYANSYPDEEDAPYGNDAATDGDEYDDDDDDDDDDDEYSAEDLADADAAGGSWGGGGALRRGRGQGAMSDDDDEDEDEGDEEIFGRRRRARQPVRSSYYRTEDDDYSEHSSFLSEDEERREAEERRRRSIFMH